MLRQTIRFSLGFSLLYLILFSCNKRIKTIPDADFSTINNYDKLFVDSIETIYSKIRGKEEKIIFLLDICQNHFLNYPEEIIFYARKVEDLVGKNKQSEAFAKAIFWKVFILNQEDPQNIKLHAYLIDLKICIEILEKRNNQLWLARALNLKALTHYNLYEEEKGLKYNQKAQKILTKAKLTEDNFPLVWGNIYRTAGNIELYTSKNTTAVLNYFDKSRSCYSKLKDNHLLARLLMNYAIVYERKNDLASADSIFQYAIEVYRKIKNIDHLSKAYLDYGTFHALRFKINKNKKWLESSNEWLGTANHLNPKFKAEIFFQFGANFQNLAIHSAHQTEALYDSACHYYRKVLSLGVIEKNHKYIEMVSVELAKICPKINPDTCKALLHSTSTAFQTLLDSTTYELNRASSIMEDFQREKAQRTYRQILLLSSLIFAVLVVIIFFTLQSSKIKLLQTRLAALRSQMNPHFISNSLNAIDSLVNRGKTEEASEYIIDFSRLCRLILNNSKEDFISLKTEIETLSYYLSLEGLRMHGKLSYRFQIEETIDQKKTLVPPLILQPFVENAIIHGIQNKQAPGLVLISIKQIYGDILECIIKDDGVGRKTALELRKKSVIEGPSFGISITSERINAIRKQKGTSITIHDIIGERGEAKGTKVTIRLPIKYLSDKISN